MNAVSPTDYLPEKVSPLRQDPPGAVTSMPSPTKLHHMHIFSDQRYDEMVDYYKLMFNAEVIKVNPDGLTFLSFDDHDHRIVIIKRDGADPMVLAGEVGPRITARGGPASGENWGIGITCRLNFAWPTRRM